MYGEINMAPEADATPKRKPRIEVVRWATSERAGTVLEVSTKTVVQLDVRIGELEAALDHARCRLGDALVDRDKLADFKNYVHQRLDEAGVPTHPDGKHSKAGCRVGDRLDLALAGYTKPVDPDLVIVRKIVSDGLRKTAAHRQAKGLLSAAGSTLADAVDAGLKDDVPLVRVTLRAYKAGKAAR